MKSNDQKNNVTAHYSCWIGLLTACFSDRFLWACTSSLLKAIDDIKNSFLAHLRTRWQSLASGFLNQADSKLSSEITVWDAVLLPGLLGPLGLPRQETLPSVGTHFTSPSKRTVFPFRVEPFCGCDFSNEVMLQYLCHTDLFYLWLWKWTSLWQFTIKKFKWCIFLVNQDLILVYLPLPFRFFPPKSFTALPLKDEQRRWK